MSSRPSRIHPLAWVAAIAALVSGCGTGARDGSCITSEQKSVLASVFAGPKNSKGEALYTGTRFDPGIAGANFASWHFGAPATRDVIVRRAPLRVEI